MSRVFAIGDIHGEAEKLNVALSHLAARVRPYDTVVFLGDYIDRGPNSADVIQQLLKFRKRHSQTVFLRGNHEDMFLRTFIEPDDQKEMLWIANGGHTTLMSFKVAGRNDWRRRMPRWALEFISDTEMEFLSERYHFVHAGILPPGTPSGLEPGQDIRLWIREPFLKSNFTQGRIVVFGHTIQENGIPLVQMNKVGLDTGACTPGGRLTVACFNDLRSRVGMPQFEYFQVLQDGSVVAQEFAGDELEVIGAPVPSMAQPMQPTFTLAEAPKRPRLFWQTKPGHL